MPMPHNAVTMATIVCLLGIIISLELDVRKGTTKIGKMRSLVPHGAFGGRFSPAIAIFAVMRLVPFRGCRLPLAALAVAVTLAGVPAEAQDFLGGFAPPGAKAQKAGERRSVGAAKPAVSLPDKPNKTDGQGRRQGEWGKKYPNGRYRYVATFRDGRPVGTVKRYYPNGRFSAVLVYDSDSDTCRVETFHEQNGKVESRGMYVGQRREGEWRFYMLDGTLLEVAPYSGGRLHGQQRVLYDDGRLLSLTTWVDSLREGPYVKFFPSGDKNVEATYRNGELEGAYKVWGADGKLVSEGQYRSGVPTGRWHVRYPDAGGLEGDIVYDSHGLVVNQDEVDKLNNAVVDFYEAQRGSFDDPADFMNNPEDYVPFPKR